MMQNEWPIYTVWAVGQGAMRTTRGRVAPAEFHVLAQGATHARRRIAVFMGKGDLSMGR